MTSYIPMMLHPKAEQALTIGLGSGMSAKALATFQSIKGIEVIEIEPAMIEASKFFDRAWVSMERLPAKVSFPCGQPERQDLVRQRRKTPLLQRRDGRTGTVALDEAVRRQGLSRRPR